VAESGVDAVAVRSVAERAGTTTRAVYALFGSKEELVQALAQRSYGLLMERVAAAPVTNDPGQDLVVAAVKGFRAFALEHPQLFRLFFVTALPPPFLSAESNDARLAALDQLIKLVERAHSAGLLGRHSVDEVTLFWDVLCTGLAMREIQCVIQPSEGERIWTNALTTLLVGLGSVPDNGARARDQRVTRRTTRAKRAIHRG
jgi:AcrR family transcriptional regulator